MEELKKALKEAFPNVDFDKEKALIDDGIIDSVGMVTIISIIEDMFDVSVTMDYIQPKYFQSVETMWEMIQEIS